MIRQFSFAASSTLAIAGGTLAVSGIVVESFKVVSVGLV
jgi:hypothetical protein